MYSDTGAVSSNRLLQVRLSNRPTDAPLADKELTCKGCAGDRLANALFFALINEAFRLPGRRDRETQLVLTQSGAWPTGVAAVVTEWEKVRANERDPPDFADAPSPIPKC